ncbi:Acid phosphatase [Purpureocillium takamizusanense]|uniref:Acid phosphatase n=1 Tax=Purpureocillium takamizusanense TaxID=2060973 RepID=A0A9Q8QLA8_9HYPO|nr:Acid phosphatase [Purpureocillium takamizusanense]UNI20617.1 Acid phosphatase [Purpureocillium takamizusanense]
MKPSFFSCSPSSSSSTTTAALFAATGIAATAALQFQNTPLYSSYSFNALEHLAGNSPYFEPVDTPGRQPDPPRGCSVTRAAYLVRHAAINANDFDYEQYLGPFLRKLGNSSSSGDSRAGWAAASPSLAFLASWEPPSFSEQEKLTRTGKVEAAQLGLSLSYRYPGLRLPRRVWTSTAERTVESAKGLARGLEVDDGSIGVVEVYEGKESGADSLTPYKSCKGYASDAGSDKQRAYVEAYTKPIVDRLNQDVARASGPAKLDFNFTTEDVVAMQALCGYETVIRGSSPFCSTDLFDPDEWLQYEYGQDIQYHYNVGYGSRVAGAIGFPWLNATLGLLSSDADVQQDMYVSFTHRELPPAVLVAMGLFNNSRFSGADDVNATMPLDQVNHGRAWVSSRILPFLANIAIERMNCSSPSSSSPSSSSSARNDSSSTTFYRVLVNRAPQVLPGCLDGPGQSCSADGLRDFVRQREALFGGFSDICGNTYKNSTDLVTFYTDASKNGTTGDK